MPPSYENIEKWFRKLVRKRSGRLGKTEEHATRWGNLSVGDDVLAVCFIHAESELSGPLNLRARSQDMMKSRYTEEQIAFALRQAETGTPVAEVIRRMGAFRSRLF